MKYSVALRAKMDALTPEQRHKMLAFFGIEEPRVQRADLDDDIRQVITLAQDEIWQKVLDDRAAPTAAEEATP